MKTAVVVLVFAAAILLLSWTPQGKATARALVFVPQVLPAVPIKPAEWFTETPERVEVAFPLRDGGSGVADLYLPQGRGKHSAVLFFLGANPAGKNDERVVNVASAIARTGTVVMIPWSERMAQRHISEKEVDDLVHGFQYLQAHENVNSDEVGMAGFCVGASLVMVAAQDERISDDVKVVNSFGGYYEAKDLIASVVSGQRFYDGASRSWQPDDLSISVARVHLLQSVEDIDERNLLKRALEEDNEPPEPLSDNGDTVYRLLKSPDIETARQLIDSLPQQSLDTLSRISPSTNIGDLRAKVLVMHDREDTLVASEESRRLVDALRPRGDVHFTEFSFFDHLDPTRPVGRFEFARESAKLFLHMYRIMRELG